MYSLPYSHPPINLATLTEDLIILQMFQRLKLTFNRSQVLTSLCVDISLPRQDPRDSVCCILNSNNVWNVNQFSIIYYFIYFLVFL